MPRKIPLTRMLSPDGQLEIIEPSAGNLGDAGPVQRCRLQRLTVGQPYPASSRPGIAEDEDAAGIVEKAMERDGVDTRCAAKMHQGTTMR